MRLSKVLLIIFLFSSLIFAEGKKGAAMKTKPGYIDYKMVVKDIDGKDVALSDFKGKALLIVNVASKCGYTKQYSGLQNLYEKYKDKGLVVLGFPANNFGQQEPGSNAEIKEFCTVNFDVTFPMFSKISVKGEDQHPLYQLLTGEKSNPEYAGEISWNFNKFLIGRDGKILSRFASGDTPESEKVITAVEKALKDK